MRGENLLKYTPLCRCKALEYLSTYPKDFMYFVYQWSPLWVVFRLSLITFLTSPETFASLGLQALDTAENWRLFGKLQYALLGWYFCGIKQYCNQMVLCYECEQVQAGCLLLWGAYSCTSYECAIPLGLCWGEYMTGVDHSATSREIWYELLL